MLVLWWLLGLSVVKMDMVTNITNQFPNQDMRFVQNFTLPKFFGKNFTPKESVNHNIVKFA